MDTSLPTPVGITDDVGYEDGLLALTSRNFVCDAIAFEPYLSPIFFCGSVDNNFCVLYVYWRHKYLAPELGRGLALHLRGHGLSSCDGI